MPAKHIHKGETVEFRLGTRSVTGTVKEDRGPIGVGGRHLYLIEFRAEPQAQHPSLVELPADQITPAQSTTARS